MVITSLLSSSMALSNVHVCTLSWLWIALGLLLPFLLGYLLAMTIWSPYKEKFIQSKHENTQLQTKNQVLSEKLVKTETELADLEQRLQSLAAKHQKLQLKLEEEAQTNILHLAKAQQSPTEAQIRESEIVRQLTREIQEFQSKIKDKETKLEQRKTADQTTDTLIEASQIMGRLVALDDLKIVEGIGPKIALILHEAGIDTWNALAAMTPDELNGLLQQAGRIYALHDPASWPEQARLADQSKWRELKTWQNDLHGGRKQDNTASP